MSKAADLLGITGSVPTAPAQKKSSKPERQDLYWGKELDLVASSKIVEKAAAGVGAALSAVIRDAAMEFCVDQMFSTKRPPETFNAHGDASKCRVSPVKMGSRSPLSQETAESLRSLGVAVDEIVDVPERIVINPEVADNEELMKALAQSISSNPEFSGVQIFALQPARTKFVVSEQTISDAARLLNKAQLTEVAHEIMTISIGGHKLDTTEANMIPLAKKILEENQVL